MNIRLNKNKMSSRATNFLKKVKKIKKKNIYKWLIICVVIIILDIFGIFNYICEQRFTDYFYYPMHGNVYQYMYNLKKERRHLVKPLNNDNYRYRILNDCSLDDGRPLPPLTLLIRSKLEHVDKRMAIRRTWGLEDQFPNVTIRRVFLLGNNKNSELLTAVEEEAKKYNDILQAELPDTKFYQTLMAMRRMTQQCRNSHYYLFVDDTYCVSTVNVLSYILHPHDYPKKKVLDSINDLQARSHYDHLFTGYVMNSRPVRQKWSKQYVSMKDYPYNKWPPYARDAVFIISRNALLDLYHTSYYVQQLPFIDIYLGIIARKGKLTINHTEYFYDVPPKKIGFFSYSSILAVNGFNSPKDMEEVWNDELQLA